MSRYIDADKAKEKFSDALPIGRSIRQTIDEIPIEDVVEVVRCKDCRYYHTCSILWESKEPRENGYCSLGERREG
jgi:hypothetical protein